MSVQISNYLIKQQLSCDSRSLVFRAQSKEDKSDVVIKTLNSEYPTLQEIARIENEKHLLEHETFSIDHRYKGWFQYQNRPALILNDGGEETLAEMIKHEISLHEFFIVSIQLTKMLAELHKIGIIHKDIKPDNILVHPINKKVKIIDFGIAEQLSQKIQEVSNPNILEGSLGYMAPEQTGRMNRAIDYRADYYSLGITFYEMLTKTLPFKSLDSDLLALIHAHMAITPLPPNQLNSKIPEVVSNIIMKLISKNSEDRYQSEYGIIADLENCLKQLEMKGIVENFSIGQHDIPVKLMISQKLYGRENDIQNLIKAFHRACEGKQELVFVKGHSGIGKSSLIHEVYKPITEKRGNFIWGKFDQYQQTPYSGWIQAFQRMIRHLLAESSEELLNWKQRILQALGANGQIIVDVIPDLELIIGKQPAVPQVDPISAKNRFELYFQKFVEALVDEGHPLTIFLDDLQWADIASLKFFENLMINRDIKYLLFIGSYRDHEVDETHILNLTIQEIQEINVIPLNIVVSPLNLLNVKDLICDTFSVKDEESLPFAELCFRKTAGNPFFLNQFLRILYDDNLVAYNFEQGRWMWDLEEIQRREFTENVVEFVTQKIKKFPKNIQNLLKLASCIGTSFDLDLLSLLNGTYPQETASILRTALNEEFVVPLTSTYKYTDNIQKLSVSYQFLHDRVQQATHTMLSEEEKKEIHFKIGNLLSKRMSAEELEEKIFDVVPHYNYALNMLTTPGEKRKVAHMNLIAGSKAKKANAYAAALAYIHSALSLLDENSWNTDYELTLNLYQIEVELYFLLRDFKEMDAHIDIAMQHARSDLEKINFVKTRCIAREVEQKFKESTTTAIDFLNSIGISFRKEVNTVTAVVDFLKIKFLFKTSNFENYLKLPRISDPLTLAILDLMVNLSVSFLRTEPKLMANFIYNGLKIFVKKGNSSYSIFFVILYAMLLYRIGNLKAAIATGEFASTLLKTFTDMPSVHNKATYLYAQIVMPWTHHFKESLALLKQVAQNGIESGDFEFASYALCTGIYNFSGDPLPKISKTFEESYSIIMKVKGFSMIEYVNRYIKVIKKLMSDIEKDAWKISENDDELEDFFKKSGDVMGLCGLYIGQMRNRLIFQQYDVALESARSYEDVKISCNAWPIGPPALFCQSLIYLRTLPWMNFKEKIKAWIIIKSNLKHLKQIAEYAPMNHLNRYYLILAEMARAKGNVNKAIANYIKAIEFSHNNNFIFEEAFCNEMAALFFIEIGGEQIAKNYLKNAYYCYLRWGAKSKLKDMEKKYYQFLTKDIVPVDKPHTINTVSTSKSNSAATESINLLSIMKSTQAISTEIDLRALIKKLLRIIIENAGAENGTLLIEKNNSLFIEGEISPKGISGLLEGLPLDKSTHLPKSLIQYVYRSKKTVILIQSDTESQFFKDPYILEFKPKSILCAPIIYKNQVIGLFYLENNLIEGAFNKEHIKILEYMSAQAAISLENARLYEVTGRFVPTQFLSQLGKRNLIEFSREDCVKQTMSILFCDIRNFTPLAEKMDPNLLLILLNDFMESMEQSIDKHRGFIDKYIGDAVMALFGDEADKAVDAAIEMLANLALLNDKKHMSLNVGIGINTGEIILGIMGGKTHLSCTVIGDVVNAAARIEELNKIYDTRILIGERTKKLLLNPSDFDLRLIDYAFIKGRSVPIEIWEVCKANPDDIRVLQMQTLEIFNQGRELYFKNEFEQAMSLFKICLKQNPSDSVSKLYLKRCRDNLNPDLNS